MKKVFYAILISRDMFEVTNHIECLLGNNMTLHSLLIVPYGH